jgi:transcriptional regulator with XRE-family HTH domain
MTIVMQVKNPTTFAERLDEALTDFGIPKDHRRIGTVAAEFGVSRESARKWLAGDALPQTERIQEIATRLECRGEWLLTGQGTKSLNETRAVTERVAQYRILSPREGELLALFGAIDEQGQRDILQAVREKKTLLELTEKIETLNRRLDAMTPGS